MPSRKHHQKTRNGCHTCKARRVRCDEEKPICRNCTRGDRVCSYPAQLVSLPTSLSSAHAHDQIFPLRDMELLHHYTAFSHRIMAGEPDHVHIWQVIIPQLAFENRFLLHGLLALTAFHIRHEADDAQQTPMLNLARYHIQHALTMYIPLLQNIDQHNCNPLFAFSLIHGVICFAMLGKSEQNPQSVINQMLDVFNALVGATVVASQAKHWIVKGEFRYLIDSLETREPHDFTDLDPEAEKALMGLVSCIDQVLPETPTDDSRLRRNAYLKSIAALSTVLAAAPGKRQLPIMVSWVIMAEADYLSLLRRRDPLALVILGHYGVALHLYGRMWMLEGLGARLTQSIVSLNTLEPRWQSHLAWAKARVAQPVVVERPAHSFEAQVDPQA